MYSYQLYRQNSQHESDLKRAQIIQRQQQKRRDLKTKEMIANYNKRIQHSILTLINHPQKIENYKDPSYKPREKDRRKWVVGHEMIFNYEKQPERILRSLQKNLSLDVIPLKYSSMSSQCISKIHKIQPGQTDNRIHMSEQIKHAEQNRSRQLLSYPTKLPKLQKLPKTYFHTLQTLVNNPDSLKISVDDRGNESVVLSLRQQPFQSTTFKQNKNTIIEKLKQEKLRKCKIVLQQCGVINTDHHSEEI